MNVLKFMRFVWLTVLSAILLICSTKLTGTVDDTDTGSKFIAVYLPNGSPAADAVIKFIPSNRSQSPALLKQLVSKAGITVVRTDSKGHFNVPALADSTYNVFMEKDSLKAFQGFVAISEQGHAVHNDTLRLAGSFQAVVGLDLRDMHNVKSVAVQILGSDVMYVNPDKNGIFSFKTVAAGTYKLRLETSLPEYSATFYTMTIRSGVDSICPDTIWLNYTGIPSVRGLSVQFDTSAGTVVLKWQPADYGNILDYVIYRDPGTDVEYSKTIFRATKDTVFFDTIYNHQKVTEQLLPNDSSIYGYRYRVAIRNNSTVVGSTYGSATVKAVPYKSVLPVIDSVRVAFDTTKGIANVTWAGTHTIDSTYDYLVIRNIKSYRASPYENVFSAGTMIFDSTDTLGHLSKPSLSDSLFNDKLSFHDSLTYEVHYSIAMYKKGWRLSGNITISSPLIIMPYFKLVPIVNHLSISYDTLKGITNVTWDNLSSFTELKGFRVIRRIQNVLHSINKTDTVSLWTHNSLTDTIYPNIIPFDETSGTQITYSISVLHASWGVRGIDKAQSTVMYSYKAFKPRVSAGFDQAVDINSDVLLQGSILSTTYPVKKIEWKVGDSSWALADSGRVQFHTNSDYDPEVIPCIFRVTDSVGNVCSDTVILTKSPLVVTFSKLPSKQGTPTIITLNSSEPNNVFLHLGEIDNGKYGVWSTTDFLTWTLMSTNIGISNFGQVFAFQGNYYIYNLYKDISYYPKSYKSANGIAWSEVTPITGQATFTTITSYTSIVPVKNSLYVGNSVYLTQYQSTKKLLKSTDAIHWDSTNLPSQGNLGKLFRLGDTLGYISDKKYMSNDGGATWQEDKMWDTDGDVFPDDVYGVAWNDSATVVSYRERPSYDIKMAVFRNGFWKILPTDFMGIQPSLNFILRENRCIIFDGSNPRSFKLF